MHGKGAVSDDFQCEPEENECSKCFDVLANELFIIDRNRYNLQRAFFPPDIANPVFVSVTYYFTRNMSGDGFTNYSLSTPSMNWFWTQSTFYLFQPLEFLQFSSLFFSDPSLRETTLSLYLQPNCSEVSLDMMKLLTQRVSYHFHSLLLPPLHAMACTRLYLCIIIYCCMYISFTTCIRDVSLFIIYVFNFSIPLYMHDV